MLPQTWPNGVALMAKDSPPGFKAIVIIVNPTKTTNNRTKNRIHFDLNISHLPFWKLKIIVSLTTHANIDIKIADFSYHKLQNDYKLSLKYL